MSADTPPPLAEQLTLTPDGEDVFIGHSPRDRQRIFGGLVIAQALMAASRTVEGRTAHALHVVFMRPGDPARPIRYRVVRPFDGGSYSTRRVTACQGETEIFAMLASFHKPEPDAFTHAFPMPRVTPPEALPSEEEVLNRLAAHLPEPIRKYLQGTRMPVEVRLCEPQRMLGEALPPERPRHVWFRIRERLPDDPLLHRAALAYASDWTLLDVALSAHGRNLFDPRLIVASIDHALWLHRDARADDWLLYVQDSPAMQAGRGFTRGLIFARDGKLAASVAQEGVVRIRQKSVS